jgi:hypothetical protein
MRFRISSQLSTPAEGVHSNGGLRTHEDLVGVEVVTAVKRLAKQQHSSALTQLASKISAVLQYGAGAGADPFAKVKGLLEAMITKLEKEAGEVDSKSVFRPPIGRVGGNAGQTIYYCC